MCKAGEDMLKRPAVVAAVGGGVSIDLEGLNTNTRYTFFIFFICKLEKKIFFFLSLHNYVVKSQ